MTVPEALRVDTARAGGHAGATASVAAIWAARVVRRKFAHYHFCLFLRRRSSVFAFMAHLPLSYST